MNIRRAKKNDFNNYYSFRIESLKELSKISGEKLVVSLKIIKKEFNDILKSKKRFLLFSVDKGQTCGLLLGSLFKNVYITSGYIDDIFIKKEYRRKGYAKKLIESFIKITKNKKATKVRLGLRTKNKKALKLYKKLGFKIKYYEMERKI